MSNNDLLDERMDFVGDTKGQLVPVMSRFLAPSCILAMGLNITTMQEVCSLARDFEGSLLHMGDLPVPVRLIHPRLFSISLEQWMERYQRMCKDGRIPKEWEEWFGLKDDLLRIPIWEDDSTNYWVAPVVSLGHWWASTARLASVEWRASDRYVEVVVTGYGEVAQVLELQGRWSDRWGFWILEMAHPETTNFPPEEMALKLLVAQLVALQRSGTLEVEVEGEHISMVLRIPRADVVSAEEVHATRLPGDVAEELVVHMLTPLLLSSWVTMCKRLVALTSRKVVELEGHPEAEVRELVEKLRKGCEKAVSVLPGLEEELSRWKEAAEGVVRVVRSRQSGGRIKLPAERSGL